MTLDKHRNSPAGHFIQRDPLFRCQSDGALVQLIRQLDLRPNHDVHFTRFVEGTRSKSTWPVAASATGVAR